MNYFLQIWNSRDLRRKILFTLGGILLFRILTQISIPGVDLVALKGVFEKNRLLGVFSALTGGSAENFSIVLMGLSPYINASIIMQLLTVVVPKLEALSKEGEYGYKQINKYTRWLAWPLSFIQSYGMILLLNSQSQVPLIPNIANPAVIIPIMLTVTTGTILLMWIGEMMTEKGIGNGVSMLIFASIISGIPQIVAQTLAVTTQEAERLLPFVGITIATVVLTVLVILITEANRRIPVTYAGRQVGGSKSFLPIMVNQAGMIPIIFAISITTFPTILAQLFKNSQTPWIQTVAEWLITNFGQTTLIYMVTYFIFIILFTFFYVSITFNPERVAENIQKRGGYIPGIRPGKETAKYVGTISNRLSLFGGSFLAFIAIAPLILQGAFSKFAVSSVPVLVSGSGLIIIVGVVLELIRQVNAQLVMHDYEKLY